MTELQTPLKHALREPVSSARTDAMWRNIYARRERRAFGWLELAAVCAACGCALALLATRAPTPMPVVAPAAAGPLLLADGRGIPALHASENAVQRVTLADGSRIELASNGELLSRASSATQVSFELVRGRVLFDVVPHGPRKWSITAGDVLVSVLGTRFSVERSAGEVVVAVERGLVRVTSGAGASSTRELHAGQALQIVTAPVLAPPPTAASEVVDTTAISSPALPAPSAARSFRSSVAGAKTADALLSIADSARLAGRTHDATLALSRLVERFPEDPGAAMAALTLGRIQLDQLQAPAEAARAFARADALGLPQALAEEGAARLVEAYAKAGKSQLARAAAARYLARFAGGRRRADVQAWVQSE